MGLLYLMPIDENETDRVIINDGKISLKSYGLPLLFWGYLAAIITVVIVMFVAIKAPLFKMMNESDPINILLAQTVLASLIGLPLILIGFYFYEKVLEKKQNQIKILHKLFGLTFYSKAHTLTSPGFIVDQYLDSPNMAKMKGDPNLRGFQNRGYFQLWAETTSGKILLDRSSRKPDLEKMGHLLSRY